MIENKKLCKLDVNVKNASKFEDVPLETFFGDDESKKAPIRGVISKIANNNKTVIEGIESLISENMLFRSFERAISLLVTAQNEKHLQRVEAALQTSVNEIKNYFGKNNSHMSDTKISLYLYTLQYLIFNLDKWKFSRKKHNNYKPILFLKLNYAEYKCKTCNLSTDLIRKLCFTDIYQQLHDENLQNFEFLDEQALENFIKCLDKYSLTHNVNDLYSGPKLEKLDLKKDRDIELIIDYIQIRFQLKELTLHFYTRNFHTVNEVIAEFIGNKDLYQIYTLANDIKNYLSRKENFTSILNVKNSNVKSNL